MSRLEYDNVFNSLKDETGYPVAEIYFSEVDENGEFSDEWNDKIDRLGRLIAAAPEMCELIREMARPSGKNCMKLEHMARELLARIYGKEKD